MTKTTNYGGSLTHTSSYTGWKPNRVYSSGFGGFPEGNVDLQGRDRVYVEDVDLAHLSGAAATPRIKKGGVTTSGGTWLDSGGSFDLEFYSSAAGNTYFGRNSGGSPSPVRNTYNSTTWSGCLVGSIDWSTVPSRPSSLTLEREGRDVTVTRGSSSDNGGETITSYTFQWSDDGGATWQGSVTTTATSHVFEGLQGGKTYKFRVYANNARGQSQARESASEFVPAGARRWDGSSEIDSATFVRWDGSSEVPVETVVRWDGSSEVAVN